MARLPSGNARMVWQCRKGALILFSSYELEVIAILSSLQERLGLTPGEFRSVIWKADYLPIDQCYLRRGKVFLSDYVRVIKPTEITPILASALIFHKLLLPTRYRLLKDFWKQFLSLLILILVVPTLLVYYDDMLGKPIPEDLVGYAILALWISSLLTYGTLYRRKLHLLGDRKAAEMVGEESFLTTLRALQRSTPEKESSLWFLREWPRLQERIRNLSA